MLDPLGMRHTGFTYQDCGDRDAATEYQRLLSPRATAAMRQVTPRGGRLDFGLGWFRPHRGEGAADFVEHLGGGSGFFNVLRLYPARRLGIVLMGNTTSYDHESIIAAIVGDAS